MGLSFSCVTITTTKQWNSHHLCLFPWPLFIVISADRALAPAGLISALQVLAFPAHHINKIIQPRWFFSLTQHFDPQDWSMCSHGSMVSFYRWIGFHCADGYATICLSSLQLVPFGLPVLGNYGWSCRTLPHTGLQVGIGSPFPE